MGLNEFQSISKRFSWFREGTWKFKNSSPGFSEVHGDF